MIKLDSLKKGTIVKTVDKQEKEEIDESKLVCEMSDLKDLSSGGLPAGYSLTGLFTDRRDNQLIVMSESLETSSIHISLHSEERKEYHEASKFSI